MPRHRPIRHTAVETEKSEDFAMSDQPIQSDSGTMLNQNAQTAGLRRFPAKPTMK